ncbi:hypothetical protein LptCag_2241 [Leptospirillum ferriphilum]|uniref:Uncharacterized protein n=1 Tax=Leptospirillum ferriphilum TaxID=178606 RepID=A0A094WGM1_9BACT|nr:hypothetical protein LptCag_2241 [Leptospirillum ferriphilum]
MILPGLDSGIHRKRFFQSNGKMKEWGKDTVFALIMWRKK